MNNQHTLKPTPSAPLLLQDSHCGFSSKVISVLTEITFQTTVPSTAGTGKELDPHQSFLRFGQPHVKVSLQTISGENFHCISFLFLTVAGSVHTFTSL